MSPITIGEQAPPIPGVTFADGPVGLFFYKVTCPVCQMAAPAIDRFERAYPGRVVGIGQDPEAELAEFSRGYRMGVRSIQDPPPYPASNAYGIETVPTLFLVAEDGIVLETVGVWDREGYNRVSARLAELVGAEPVVISEPDDGLPPFRPG